MIDIIIALGIEARKHPAGALALLAPGVWLLLRHVRPTLASSTWRTSVPALPAGVLLAYAALVLLYTSESSFYDPAESTIPAVAWTFWSGGEMYPALDAPERYVHIYGPVLFITNAWVLWLVGPGVAASKLVGTCGAFLSLGVSYVTVKRLSDHVSAVTSVGLSALVYLCFANSSWWTRADPLLILLAAVGMWAGGLRSATASAVILGAACGLSMNLKVTGPLYLIPGIMLAFGSARLQARWLLIASAVGAIVTVAPFLHPRISLTAYVDYLQLSAGAGLEWPIFRRNLEWILFAAAPVAALWWSRGSVPSPDRPVVASLIVAAVIAATAGSKPGGGPLHLLPFVPAVAYLGVRVSIPSRLTFSGARALFSSFVLVALIIAVASQCILVRTVHDRDLGIAMSEVRDVIAQYEGSRVDVGYAGVSYLSHARLQGVLRSGKYLIDAPAVQEHRLAGLDIPPATIQAIAACVADIWLIPRGGRPFDVPSAYVPRGPSDVFPESFRATFLKHYQRTGVTQHFEIWICAGRNESR